MEIDNRIRILQKILKRSQTMPTMQTMDQAAKPDEAKPAETKPPVPAKQPPVTPPPKQPSAPGATPPTTVKPNPVTTNNNQDNQQEQEEEQNQLEKQQGYISEIVKYALDNRQNMLLKATRYYNRNETREKMVGLLKGKGIAMMNIEGEVLRPYVIESEAEYNEMVKRGAICIYEPVASHTKSFRISFADNKDRNSLLANMRIVANMFEKKGFDTKIVKSGDRYQIKCISENDVDTSELRSLAEKISKDIDMDISELKPGKLKRAYYSLDDSGREDTIINIQEK